MLSICGSIYMNGNIVPFVRSVLDQSHDPDNIEFCIVEDESGSELMGEAFNKLKSMTRRIKIHPIPKQERILHTRKCIAFYERENIFQKVEISEFRERLDFYERGKIDHLWLFPGRAYNQSIRMASGEVVLNTPLDLLIHFDISRIYKEFCEAKASRKHFSVHFGLKNGNQIRHHGTRMFNRSLFDTLLEEDDRFSAKPFSFDERWFYGPRCEDDWNEKAMQAGAWGLGWEEIFGKQLLFSMPDSPWQPEYLCRNMVQDWAKINDRIGQYLLRRPRALFS